LSLGDLSLPSTARVVLAFAVLALAAINTACGGGGLAPATSQTKGSGVVQDPDLSVISVGRDFGVGVARLPLAILRRDQTSVNDRAGDLNVAYGVVNSGRLKRLAGLTWRAWPVLNGVYVGFPEFDAAGIWEIKVTLYESGRELRGSTFVEVKNRPVSPAIGDTAPASVTKTASTTDEMRSVTSAREPDPDLYRLSLSESLRSGRPTVVTFSTPAFCTTQTCGPQVEVLSKLQDRYGGRANFIHVEIYDNQREMLEKGDISIGRIAPAVNEWKLETEPWTFLIGKDGRIFARFEAFTTEAELDEAVQLLLDEG
jgi:hypothetical protein